MNEEEFLHAIRQVGSVEGAIRALDSDRTEVAAWLAKPETARAVEAAIFASLDYVRSALLRRAIGFTDKANRFVFSDRAAEILFAGTRSTDGPNRQALELAVSMKGEDDLPATLVQAARSLADSVDRSPDNANLWRQYRDALEELGLTDDDSGDILGDVLAEILNAED